MSVASTRGWTLERNDRRLDFVTGPAVTMFTESGGFRVTAHRHPAWKVVLAAGGLVEVGHAGHTVTAPGMIVPPQLAHTCAVSSAYVALLLEPWELPRTTHPIRIDGAATRRILAATGDLAAARRAIMALTGRGAALEPRVAHAVGLITGAGRVLPIARLAAEVGLSAPRLRALVRESIGIPLPRLRQWSRLRSAIAELPGESAAAAAAGAGFADQAHLTRTARSLIGRTPSEISGGGRPG